MSDRSIKSAERTLAIFELFSVRQEMLTVGDVSKSLDIPQPSVSMLLKNLTNMGYLEYDAPQRRYAPTLRVMLLNSWLLDRYEGTAKFVPILKSLLLELQETVFIGMQNKSTAQYILVMTPKNRDSLLITSGMHRSLTCSAMGRILLSMTGEEELHRWIRRCNAEATDPRFRVREAPYLDLIAADRSKGYAETAGDISPGFGAIAVAVPSPLGGTPLAIGAGARVERIAQKRDTIVLGLRHAASLIATRQPLTDTNRPAAEASVEAEGAPTPAGGPHFRPCLHGSAIGSHERSRLAQDVPRQAALAVSFFSPMMSTLD